MIEVKKINKTYLSGENQVAALVDINIKFRNSEFVTILGPSGCGKTTLLNVLGGLDRYDSGDVIVNGISTKEYTDLDWDSYRNHYVGFVFQSYNLIPHLSVLENVELALSIAGLSKEEKKKKAVAALKTVGLASQVYKKPNQLSGGQMQRVAIARAIVNDPEIILADEPTGALDTETSVQVMDILKEISKKHLVIMVTHNEQLAQKYSSRTINLLDGKIIADSNPPQEIMKKEKKVVSKKANMAIKTAFNLSLKNLISKKAKTILTSLAGSIGIVGISLVLAVSNGFNAYLNNMQSETLNSSPVSISPVALDMQGIRDYMANNQNKDDGEKNDEQLTIYDLTEIIGKMGRYNYLNKDFLDYITNYYEEDQKVSEDNQLFNQMQISYASAMNIYTEFNNTIKKIDTTVSTSTLSGTTSSTFFEGLNEDFVLSLYDMLGGENAHYPQNKNEVALIVNSDNSFSSQSLTDLGIDYLKNEDGTFHEITFESLIGKEYRLVLNNDYYNPIYVGGSEEKNILRFDTPTEGSLSTLYENENNVSLKISCILRIKENVSGELFNTGIMYTQDLTDYYRSNCKNSLIAAATVNNKSLYVPYQIDISELKRFLATDGDTFTFLDPYSIQGYLKKQFNLELTIEEVLDISLQMVGASDVPSGIYVYPKNFSAKETILSYLDDYNKTESGKKYQVVYTDSSSFLTETLGQVVDIVSYVLIAFAAISLIVSSVMIGIITYTSVVERTKEIGVLRSIGARKRDITRVFNAETIITGLSAGIIGILISFILSFPISAIIKAVAGGVVTTSMAIVDPLQSLVLILISVLLTFTAGLIPAKLAAKKDPVKALRSE